MRLSLPVARVGSRVSEGVGFGVVVLSMLLGGLFFLFVQQPALRVLVSDGPSLWRLSSASILENALFTLVILGYCDQLSSPRDIYDRLRINRPLGVHTAIGIIMLCAPLVLLFVALSDGILRMALLFMGAFLLRLMVAFADARDMPRLATGAVAGFLFGLWSGFTLGDHGQKAFACGSDTLELRTGERLACKGLIRMESRGLWLVEGPAPPRLINDRDAFLIRTAER